MKLLFTLVLLLALGAGENAWGRGGGGCLELGTLILTPAGNVPIEHLQPGDAVLTFSDGQLRQATVQARLEVQPEEYLCLSVADRTLRVTPEHPSAIDKGEFRLASHLRAGETLRGWDSDRLQSAGLVSIERVKATRPAYNLLVSPFGTFLANGVLVHNKGCFLPDTPILRADGSSIAISDVREGDELLAFTTDGEIVHSRVHEVLRHEIEEFSIVGTETTVLRVTPEHPFYVGNGTFKTLEVLRVGDLIFAFDGHGLSKQRITRLEKVHERCRVYNVQTDAPHTFFAHGVAVHNKGGCFPAGTPVLTPKGEVSIERLRRGDLIQAVDDRGRAIRTIVESSFVTRSTLLILETDSGVLRTTAEHPVLMADGSFRHADEFFPGDRIMMLRGGRLRLATIQRRSESAKQERVFNLRVGAPHTFVAAGFVVHNKGGGCFPAGTLIQTRNGGMPIERLGPGDRVLAVGEQRQVSEATVAKIHVERARILIVETDLASLHTTAEHPLCLASGGFRSAGELKRGERVLLRYQGEFRVATVRTTRETGEDEEVFDLEVAAPHAFIADRFVVHNKGGGFHGGGYRGSSGGSGNPQDAGMVIGIICAFFVLWLIFWTIRTKQLRDENLDFVFTRSAIASKATKTFKLLDFISKVDPTFAPTELEKVTESTFVQLQKWWQARKYEAMKPLLMPDLYADHCSQLAGMMRNHEINVISGLEVKRIDIVNVRYTHNPNEREFTALITASARDYYIDDRTREFLRGDDSPATFQEFWTFQFVDGKWLLREIEQTRESDALKNENFFEQFTDEGLKQVYAEAASPGGPAGPWLERATETKATRIERLLNFLGKTDRIWNRQQMLERARQVFTRVYLAWERGDPAAIPSVDLFSEYAARMAEGIRQQKESGISVEYRNLCVRKVELILVRNFADNTRDEFTVRLSAHAQYIVRRQGQVIQQDDYVSPFVEYWTFGRRDGLWKLKEVLLPAEGEDAIARENVDEESSPEQLQWYYRKTRAV